MKNTNLVLLTFVFLLFSSFCFGQKEAKYLMYKAHSFVDNPEKRVEALDTYAQAMRVAKKRKLIKEIARGMHTCALYLGQDANEFKDKNNPNANAVYSKSWEAFKSGEKKLNRNEMNPYVIYIASMSALELNKAEEVQPYLNYLKRRNFGKAKVYAMLVDSYKDTNPKQAKTVLEEGLSKYPDSKELLVYENR